MLLLVVVVHSWFVFAVTTPGTMGSVTRVALLNESIAQEVARAVRVVHGAELSWCVVARGVILISYLAALCSIPSPQSLMQQHDKSNDSVMRRRRQSKTLQLAAAALAMSGADLDDPSLLQSPADQEVCSGLLRGWRLMRMIPGW